MTIYAQNVLTDNFYEKYDFLQVTLLYVVQGSINWKISPLRGISVDVLRWEILKGEEKTAERKGRNRKEKMKKEERKRKNET